MSVIVVLGDRGLCLPAKDDDWEQRVVRLLCYLREIGARH